MAYTTQVSRRMLTGARLDAVLHEGDNLPKPALPRRGGLASASFPAWRPVALARLGYRASACFHGNFLSA